MPCPQQKVINVINAKVGYWEGSGRRIFEALSQNLHGGTEENWRSNTSLKCYRCDNALGFLVIPSWSRG
jgi:hypothetical protein